VTERLHSLGRLCQPFAPCPIFPLLPANMCSPCVQLQSVKVIRNKATGYSEGYGFVEFSSHAVALNILQTYHGTPMLQCPEQLFRLNWASFGMGDRRYAGEFCCLAG